MTRITPRPKSARSRLAAAAEEAQRRFDSHTSYCGKCYRRSIGIGDWCADGRDLERIARQSRRRAA